MICQVRIFNQFTFLIRSFHFLIELLQKLLQARSLIILMLVIGVDIWRILLMISVLLWGPILLLRVHTPLKILGGVLILLGVKILALILVYIV